MIFTHQSCAQLDNTLVASWSRTLAVVAYSSVLHRSKSSAYIANFTGDGNFLIRSLMNTKKSVGDMTPPCGTPCLRSIFLLFVLSMTTLARRLFRYDLIQQNIFPAMLHFFSFRSRLSVHAEFSIVVVCHDQVRRKVSQGSRCQDSRCRGSYTHQLIPPDSAIDPLVTSQSGVWCKQTGVSHLVVKVCEVVVASYRRYRSSHWLYDNPQRFEDQNIMNVTNTSILYTGSWYLG